jgi:hypothetical protein
VEGGYLEGLIGDLLRREYGAAQFRAYPRPVGLTVNPSLIAPANPDRALIVVCNIGVQHARVNWMFPTPTMEGIVLAAGGGNLISSLQQDVIVPSLEWWAWSVFDVTTLFVVDVVKDTDIP